MVYQVFIHKAKEKTISQFENGSWYLEPEWKDIICREITSNLDIVEDNYLTDWHDIENVLTLEVLRRNTKDSKTNDVVNWLYELINTVVEPAMLEEETDYVKNVLEYMKANHEIQKSK